MRLKKLQFGIGGNFMFTNNVKFNPFRLCIHNFQYMRLSIRFQVFKFDIDVVLFSKKFHKAFVLIFLNHNSSFIWSLVSFNWLCNVNQCCPPRCTFAYQTISHDLRVVMTWELLVVNPLKRGETVKVQWTIS